MKYPQINNILIIGFGHHAKRIHFPVIEAVDNAQIVGIVDIVSEKQLVEEYLEAKNKKVDKLLFRSANNVNIDTLTKFADKLNTNSVIVSTGPDSHCLYSSWALKQGYSVLMDKPVHAENNSAHNKKSARKIHKEYIRLLKTYEKYKKQYPYLACEVLSQRRYHPAYKIIKDNIENIYSLSNCPITYYYAFHNDGQWRLPTEISEIDYHGFKDGYGKASHSGYHFYDLLNWFTSNFREEKNIEYLQTKSWANFPVNYLKQIDSAVLNKTFNENVDKNENDISKYGEIDVMSTIQLCANDTVITHAQIDLLHSGLSSRSWIDVSGRNLYKGNGRVRHEQHYIAMGPFASILLTSWQSKPFDSEQINNSNIFKPGHEFNLDITICRNSKIVGGKDVETYTLNDFYDPTLTGYSRGHQEDARRNAIIQFNDLVVNGNNTGASTLASHLLTSKIMSSVYESLATNETIKNHI
jgi:Oxidoreductase family, NAD-binding Rossmann fold